MVSFGEGTPEYQRIKKEWDNLGKLTAMIAAAAAGLSVGLPQEEPEDEKCEPIGIMKLWKETK